MPKRRHIDVNLAFRSRKKVIVQECINKISGQLHHRIWRPAELRTITVGARQQCKETNDQLQHKIWDLEGFLHQDIMTKRSQNFSTVGV